MDYDTIADNTSPVTFLEAVPENAVFWCLNIFFLNSRPSVTQGFRICSRDA